ncbi:MAG: hypothetical protein COV44_01390 [Deltaproteobacteria bacterium CG11_big_fil_rev_8_21_14_0_20_45_16]|nr:MAG: hypothetical protein COV44_01390 [Deltaproteobacteria bacterium CG11_big_fil_rev_8_21_14_0_20_45_16]
MNVIPAQADEPEIILFSSLSELTSYLGYPCTHGLFDAKQNKIYATKQSLAHEIAHFKDFKSRRMKSIGAMKTEEDKISAVLRNEMVAILYAWSRKPEPQDFLKHEKELLEAFYYCKDNQIIEGLKKELEDMSFKEIQALAETLSSPNFELYPKFKTLFHHYMDTAERELQVASRLLLDSHG